MSFKYYLENLSLLYLIWKNECISLKIYVSKLIKFYMFCEKFGDDNQKTEYSYLKKKSVDDFIPNLQVNIHI